ncbi:MAG: hypothetical protein V4671_19550 [Armatimonadota bacterium]
MKSKSAAPSTTALVASALERAFYEVLKGPSRNYVLQRDEDATGVSGTGIVADVVETAGGTAVMRWRTNPAGDGPGCTGIYPNIAAIEKIHGHEGRTRLVPVLA